MAGRACSRAPGTARRQGFFRVSYGQRDVRVRVSEGLWGGLRSVLQPGNAQLTGPVPQGLLYPVLRSDGPNSYTTCAALLCGGARTLIAARRSPPYLVCHGDAS